MRKLVLFIPFLALIIPFYVPYLYKVASLTVKPYVPSGDDIATHVYYTLISLPLA